MNKELAVCVGKGHMRRLLPTEETTDGEWAHLQSDVRDVSNTNGDGWGEVLSMGETPPTLHPLE